MGEVHTYLHTHTHPRINRNGHTQKRKRWENVYMSMPCPSV